MFGEFNDEREVNDERDGIDGLLVETAEQEPYIDCLESDSEPEPDFEDEGWESVEDISVIGPDGEEMPVYMGDIRDNTVEVVGHCEYEEAQLAIDMADAERRKHFADKIQSGNFCEVDFCGPIKDMEDIQNQRKIEEEELAILRKLKGWSAPPYTEEFKPEL